MKPLFSEEEFVAGTGKSYFKFECIQCGAIFQKIKKNINDANRKGKGFGNCFCSLNCHGAYQTKVGKVTGKKCRHCNVNNALFYSKYSNGDFCSKHCALKYSSNINKETKNYNIKKRWGTENRVIKIKQPRVYKPKKIIPLEKQKFKNSLISFCDCCKAVIKNKHRKYCNICSPYKQFVKFYDKLQIKGITLKEKNINAIERFNYLYWELEKSKIDLENEYGLNTNSIFIFCRNNNIQLRTVGQGVSVAFKNLKIKVSNPSDNSFYKQEYHTGHTGQVFFCRSSYETRLANKLDEFKEYYEYEGLSIPYKQSGNTAYYLPDFYLPQHNLILEPKSKYFFKTRNEKIQSQYNEVIKLGYKIHYIFEEDIKLVPKFNSFNELYNHFQNRNYFK